VKTTDLNLKPASSRSQRPRFHQTSALPRPVLDSSDNNWLPTITANYHVHANWSTDAQFPEGSVIPPSVVFDVPGGNVLVPQKPTLAKNY
jgi:hypothetical protein